ncbi:hypothetical protein [Vibrio coralliirubri]|uniref:hypothetical protein n=1 Tax=Vibrio coralliirubri TaxID=1516159 RepID=UPI000769D4E3|nr:hypothetical protein [Vibrio coralliirubri]
MESDCKKYKNESKPSQRVKKVLAEHTNGLIPETEAIFPNLVGDKASLRIDLYYPIQKVAIEVQSRIHTTEIIDFFGGEEGMILRNKYDDKKRKFFDENKDAYHFYAINGEGTSTYIENTVKEIVKKHFS